jgi:Ser/Thr protein kinase RdoA (MazF antagonist)
MGDGNGVQTSMFPVRTSVLAPEALVERVLPGYGLPEPRQCRLISRSMNDTYRVKAGAETYFLRVTGYGWRSRYAVAAELAAIADLHARGVAVAPAVRREDGTVLMSLPAPEGERFAALFAEAPGESVRDITLEQARAYGRLAAALHAAADAAPTDYHRFQLDESHLLNEPLQAIRAALADVDAGDGKDLVFLEETAERVRHRLRALPRTPPGYGLCHGDLHPANVCFDAAGAPTLFDFDCMGYGWRAYDLTVFLWNAFGERRPKRWRETRWRAFLRGYEEVRPLPEELDAMLPLFLVARQIWLMGMDAADRSGWPPQWLTADWLRDAVRSVRAWVAEYPTLDG